MNKKAIIFGILLLLWMGFIYFMSSTPGDESGGKSSRIVSYIINKCDQITHASAETIAYHQTLEFLDHANHIFRKTCHFMEYLILSILAFSFFFTLNCSLLWCSLASFILSLLYSFVDEYHQTFVNGRSAQILDIIIDSAGILFGCALLLIICHKIRKL